MSTVPKKRGRPPEAKRQRINLYVKPEIITRIDDQIDRKRPSRGKVVESKFED